MAAQQQCPLDLDIYKQGGKMVLSQVEAIETHISAPGNCIHPSLNKLVLQGRSTSTSYYKSTPLLLACSEGDLAAVKRIVEHWAVDVRGGRAAAIYPLSIGSYVREIAGATPLFVAAINGHESVVRYLAEKGADISVRTTFSSSFYGGMNPLCGALIQIYYDFNPALHIANPLREKKTDVVRLLLELGAKPSPLLKSEFPAWMMNLCSSNVTAICELINHGMRLDQRNPDDGSTVLHHWAGNPLGVLLEERTEEESPLVVVKLLVEKGADLMALDNNGFTPILIAAREFLPRTSRENFAIFDFLLDSKVIHRQEKIDALELIGAVILSDPGNVFFFPKAFYYWRRALHLREMDGTEPALLKTPMKRKEGLTTEWITSAQLEHVIQDSSQHLVQSFLVRLRIYSSKSSKAAFGYLDKCLLEPPLPWIAQNKIIEILWAILEMNPNFQQEGLTWHISTKVVAFIYDILLKLPKDDPLMTTGTIQTTLELILSTEKRHLLDENMLVVYRKKMLSYMHTLFHLITMLVGRHPELLNADIELLLIELVTLERPTKHGRNLIHVACNKILPPDLATLKLLLRLGADPSEGDLDGNGPLHLILAECYPIKPNGLEIARLLVDSGAHLDRVNKKGQTAVDVWNEAKSKFPGAPQMDRLPDWCYESIPKLSCLSARVVRSHNIFYTAETLPQTLHKFVEMH